MNILAAIAVSMVLAVMPLISYADDKADVGIMQKKPLIIMDQGSFTVGGRVIKESGTYDESHALSPAGQEKHVDQGYVFYQVPANAKKARVALPLKLRRTGGKDSRRFFSERGIRCTLWTSPAGAAPVLPVWKEQ